MDVPLSALKYVLTAENAQRYEPFGLVISKSYAYEKDCRPVRYLSDAEAEEMRVPTSQLWCVVRFDGVGEDDRDGRTSVNGVQRVAFRSLGRSGPCL